MNCRPNDLAIVVSEFTAGCSFHGATGDIADATVSTRNCTGRIVRVVGITIEDAAVWYIETPAVVKASISGAKDGGWFFCDSTVKIRAVPDNVLQPLRGQVVQQHESEEVKA